MPFATVNTGIWFYGLGGPGAGFWERQFSDEGSINVQWFGASAAISDNTSSIQNTIDFASSFGYNVFIPKGNYSVSTILLKSYVHIFGEGYLSILQFRLDLDPNPFIFFVDTQSGSVANNIKNVRISNIKFTPGSFTTLSEYKHFIFVNGVSDLTIERCHSQFRGDAICIGAGNGITPPTQHITHNENITIRDCVFDGVTKQNRNAISILDCKNALIENNSFINTTRSDMPGAIDIEPNPTPSGTCNEILKNIIIQNNSFYNIGGIAPFVVKLPGYPFTIPASGIYFRNNRLENVTGGVNFWYKYVPAGGIEVKKNLAFY